MEFWKRDSEVVLAAGNATKLKFKIIVFLGTAFLEYEMVDLADLPTTFEKSVRGLQREP